MECSGRTRPQKKAAVANTRGESTRAGINSSANPHCVAVLFGQRFDGGSMKTRDREMIPSFLSIDVEPDAFQISRDDKEQHWPGYQAFPLQLGERRGAPLFNP